MTAHDFLHLDVSEQKIALFEARKVSERVEDLFKLELFAIDDFFVESRTSRTSRTNRSLQVYFADQADEVLKQYIIHLERQTA